MDLGYRHRFGLRFALLTLGLILITAFVVHSLPGAASVSDVGEPDPGAGTAAARHDVRTGLALGLLLSVVGAAAVYTYCQLLLRPVDDLGQALASILDCDLSSSDEEEDAQDYESTLGGAGTGDDNVDAAKKPSDRPPDGDSGLDGTVRRLERAGIDVRTTVRHLKHREQGRSGEDMRERAIAQALLHGTTDAVITVDERGIIRSFDAMAETMFGHKAEDVIGRNVGCLMPAPEAEKHDAYLHAYRRTGKRRMIGQEREVTALRADYTTFPIRIAVSELEVHGNRVFAAVMRDITERKRSENALEASEARMRAILDTAADGIITADEWGTIESFNAAAEQMFGYRAWEMIGKYIGELMAPSPNGSGDRAAAENGGRLAANPDESGADPNEEGADSASGSLSPNGFRNMVGQKQDAFGVRRDGSRFPMELAVSEVEVGEERVLTAIVRDVTERSEVEGVLARRAEELQRRNEELAQFAYVASHDLQEPLRMVSSYTQLLERRYKGQLDEDADEFISYAVDGANRMQRLLRALLAYSRIGTKGQAFQPTDCEAVWDRVMANLEAAIDESQAVVTHEHLPTVTADASQLDQLLQNLISNAIKFRGADSPRVHVTAERFRGAWKFSVADNGIGIEPDYHERVFVIFQRLHTKDEYPGTGIGLAICKKIVERHGGRIWVESKPGEGSVFHFTLPDNPGMGTETDPANIAIDSSSRPQLKADVEQPHASSHASRESATRASHSSAEEPVALPTPSALSMALAARRDKDDEREYD